MQSGASGSEAVRGERLFDGRLYAITLDRPDRKNALSPAEWQAIHGHLDEIDRDGAIRVILIRGAGGVFCAGGDLKSMPERLEWPLHRRRQQLLSDTRVIARLYEQERPVVAAVAGPCMGAGLSLALACDLRIAAADASFGAVFHRVGLTGDFGLLWLLPRVVGPARAKELLLCAEIVGAEQARALDLCHRVVAPEALERESLALCERLCDGPPLAHGLTKKGLHRALSQDLAATLEWEAHAQALLGKSADSREGVQAFLERRRPQFRGE